MSIKLNDGTILRNLEEQVQYLTNYHDVNQGLVQWGIRVVGQVETVQELPDPVTYKGEYGDCYAVGYEAPFDFYIWTRASIVGDPDYWFPFGQISIVGPQGPQGPQGEKGDTGESTKIVPAQYIPSGLNPGDIWLSTGTGAGIGVLYEAYINDQGVLTWRNVGNIRGPQGIQGVQGPKGEDGKDGEQGPPGPQGDVGGFINIWGILSNVGQLPTPASLNNLTVAYLVGTTEPYNLYIQVGESSQTAIWENTGPFNTATAVSVGGVYQNVWDADTKLDKNTSITTYSQVYVKVPDGTQTSLSVSDTVTGEHIVSRRSDGTIFVPTNTALSNAAISKYQADDSYVPLRTTTTGKYAYAYDQSGQTSNQIAASNIVYSLVQRRDGNTFDCGTPTAAEHVTNKQYVDDNFVSKAIPLSGVEMYYATNSGQKSFNLGTDGILGFSGNTPVSLKYDVNETANSIPRRNASGMIYVNVPVDESTASFTDSTAVNKKYVNNKFLAKGTEVTNNNQAYIKRYNGEQMFIDLNPDGAIPRTIVQRTDDGDVVVPNVPVRANGATSKSYVDPIFCSIDINDTQETYSIRIPAYLKNNRASYVGACCSSDETHVIIAYSESREEFLILDTTDNSTFWAAGTIRVQ